MKRNFSTLLLSSLALLLLLPAHTAFGQSADELLERLGAAYGENESIRASVTQTVESPFNNRAQQISGTLYMQGDRYRVETDQQTVVTDGATVWIYTPAENQVIINDYVEDETAFSPSDFFMNHSERYDATTRGTEQVDGATHHVLDLRPREQDTFFQRVRLWMRDADNVVTRLEVEDIDGSIIQFEMADVQFDAPVSADTFQFSPPAGADVVDLRS